MRQKNNKNTAEQSTPNINKAKPTKKNSTLHKKIVFKDAVAIPPNRLFHILSRWIAPDSTLNGSNSTGQQGTSNRTLKRCLIILSIAKNNNNAITLG